MAAAVMRGGRGSTALLSDFYPYVATPEKFAEFSLKDFRLGLHYLLRNADPKAARQLIFIGEQIQVRQLLSGEDLRAYERLFNLMRRVDRKENKLNYELNIGARRFKCTTIPIVRPGYGVVGAICINIDINYVRDELLKSVENTAAFLAQYCQTDVKLDETILSKEEYRLALTGKRHFRDTAVSGRAPPAYS
jgi:hypothetical protein